MLTEDWKGAIILGVKVEMKEKTKRYAFQVYLNEADSERFEAFVRETGMKKLAVVRKAILRYIDENEQNAKN